MQKQAQPTVPQIDTGTGGSGKGGPTVPNVPRPQTRNLAKRLERVVIPCKPPKIDGGKEYA